MEDITFQKAMLALAYVATVDEFPGCDIREPERLKKVLQNPPSTKKSVDSLLLQEPKSDIPYEVEPSKEMLAEFQSLEKLLFHESNDISIPTEVPFVPSSVKELSVLNSIPSVQTPLEEILTKIQINDLKIKYVKAQNQILQSYLKNGIQILKALPPTGDEKSIYETFKETYPNLESPIVDIDAIHEFLSKASCSLHEIEFLTSILREHELRNKKL